MLNIFHILVFAGVIVLFAFICLIIFIYVSNWQGAIVLYFVNVVLSGILLYSLLMYVEEHTKQATLTDIKFARNLRTESVYITGRVSNITQYPINKCFLELTITDKVGSDGAVFNPKNQKNIQKGSNSVNYVVQIISNLQGNAYKDFSVSIPFPPQFINAEIYHILNCI